MSILGSKAIGDVDVSHDLDPGNDAGEDGHRHLHELPHHAVHAKRTTPLVAAGCM